MSKELASLDSLIEYVKEKLDEFQKSEMCSFKRFIM